MDALIRYFELRRLIRSVKTNNLKPAEKLDTEYGYDAVGNRRTEKVNGALATYFYNGLNQLIVKSGGNPATTANYTYDANGNQITEKVGNNAVTSFEYDVDNQLVSVK